MTTDEIKARIEEAGDTLKRLRVTGAWPQEFGSAWPDFPQEEWDAGWEYVQTINDQTGRMATALRRVGTRPPKIGLSAEDISKFDQVMSWIEMIGDDVERDRLMRLFGFSPDGAETTIVLRRKILWAKMLGLSFRKIGKRMGRSHEWTRQEHDATIQRIANRMCDASRSDRQLA